MRIVRLAVIALLGAAVSCGDDLVAPPRDADLPVQTGELEYTLRDEMDLSRTGEVSYTITNRTNADIHIPYCETPAVIIDEQRGDGWRRAYTPIVRDCFTSPPIHLAPGESRSFTFSIVAHPRFSTRFPQFLPDTEPPGTYRMRVIDPHGSCTPTACDSSTAMGEDLLVSNTFVIR